MMIERKYILWAALPAVGALMAALVAQYGFGLHPCHLCVVQRYPYAVIIGIGAAALLWKLDKKWVLGVLGALTLLYLSDAGIAFYHAGVEKGIFPGPDSCTIDANATGDVMAQILNAPLVACDTPAFEFLGLSMAGWNALYAGAAAAWCFVLWRRRRAHA